MLIAQRPILMGIPCTSTSAPTLCHPGGPFFPSLHFEVVDKYILCAIFSFIFLSFSWGRFIWIKRNNIFNIVDAHNGCDHDLNYFSSFGEKQCLIIFSLIISETTHLSRVWFLGNRKQ